MMSRLSINSPRHEVKHAYKNHALKQRVYLKSKLEELIEDMFRRAMSKSNRKVKILSMK